MKSAVRPKPFALRYHRLTRASIVQTERVLSGNFGATVPVRANQRGAALLAALLTVALVASMSAAAVWHQWRGVEVETAERQQAQAAWLLAGALDWARLILREDAAGGQVDHLAETWALPLVESRLSGFLAAGEGQAQLASEQADEAYQAFLSGRILDMQARLNVNNLLAQNGQLSEPALLSWRKLFELLALPSTELDALAQNLLRSQQRDAPNQAGEDRPLAPQRLSQLVWLGLSAASLQRLLPFITLLPARTPVNLNTAAPEVLYAAILPLDMEGARRLAQTRDREPFRNMAEAQRALPALGNQPNQADLGLGSRFFEVQGRLRLDRFVVEEISLVQRDGLEVKTLWRERGAHGLAEVVQAAAAPVR